MKPDPAPQPVPEKFHYEEELSRIKLDLEAISRTAIMAKRLKKDQLERSGKLEQLVVLEAEEQTQDDADKEVEVEPTETTEKEEEDGAESKEEDNKAESVIIDIE